MSNFKLIENIINMSEKKNWEDAKKEWDILYSYINESFNSCLCGHYPIKEIIVLRNHLNNNQTIVGNCCINKFFEIKDFNKFFKAISKNKINKFIIEIALEKKIINSWEKEFLLNTWRKKNLTQKQQSLYKNLKEKIIFSFKKEEGKKDDTPNFE